MRTPAHTEREKMKKPTKIYKNTYQIGSSEISGRKDCCIYLIDTGTNLVLIDTGAGRTFDVLIENIQSLDFEPENLEKIIVTHAHIDHIGTLSEFKKEFDTSIIAHKKDAKKIETGENIGADLYGLPYEPCQVDKKISEKTKTLEMGNQTFKILHIPGHTPGSIAIYLDIEDKRVLFGQDIHGPYSLPGANVSQAQNSLKKLLKLKADILCEGHYGIYRPEKRVEEYIRECLEKIS